MKPQRTRMLGGERGMVLVVALLLVAVLALLGSTAVMTTSTDLKISANFKGGVEAFYVAEAGLERANFALRAANVNALLKGADGAGGNSDDGILSFGSSVALGNGSYSVRVTDNDDGDGDPYTDTDGRVVVTSTGALPEGSSRVVQSLMAKAVPSSGGLRAAVMANGPIGTLGTLTVDGRDHDIDGNLVAQAGTLGISTKSTYSQGGNSHVGGTDNSTSPPADQTPAKPGPASVIEENGTWPAVPSPDVVLGLPDGTLKAYAQSGEGGSQYVTDPANLTMPMSGVTYVELAPGQTWQGGDFGNSRGILVVHNPSNNAILKNTNGGSFKGVMIVDDFIHIHNTLIGAVVNLTTAPSTGNCIGNGSGDILFSRAAIGDALADLTTVRSLSWKDVE